MGITSSLNAGVMGLAVNGTKLAAISDNIANSETPGYKRVDTEFTSLVLGDGGGSFTAGGVRANTIRFIEEEGPLQTTNNPTDISVGGSGFLPVTNLNGLNASNGIRDLLLVSTGSFRPDEDGFLKNSAGQFLMGWPVNANGEVIRAARDSAAGLEPVNTRNNQLSSTPTTEIGLGVNLPATATQPGAAGAALEAPIEYFDNLGRSQVLTARFTPVVPAAGNPPSNSWTVDIFDGAGDPATPVATFDISFQDNATTPGALDTVTPGAGATWDPATGRITVDVERGPIDLEIGPTDGTSLMTQLAADFSPIGISKDGVAVGNLTSVEIGPDGMLQAIFDNGFRQAIYQIPVADVPNQNALTAVDGQAYAISQDSGNVFFYDAGTGPVGSTVGFALAGSTTDVAAELTALIETQRAYSSNARIIQTVDEMLEETTNLKR